MISSSQKKKKKKWSQLLLITHLKSESENSGIVMSVNISANTITI